jgi:Domain of unknown function (DUF222)
MCAPGQAPAAAPATAADAVAMARAGLAWLAAADPGSLTPAEQADCLRGLEAAEAAHVAARSAVLAGFTAQGGYEDDGAATARSWLLAQARVTRAAAAAAVGWMRRLAAHPAVAAALAAGAISASWAQRVCEWTEALPGDARAEADVILLAAAAGGAELADLEALAEEIRSRTARPDADGDGDGGFGERFLRLDTYFRGNGRLAGDLTPQCAAALAAVLEALGKKAGPEDDRSAAQRAHDALEEAMRRLIASGMLPERAGQPTQIMLHMTLQQLLGIAGGADSARDGDAGDAEEESAAADRGGEAAADAGPAAGQGGSAPPPAPPAGPGYDCDATIIPVVTGTVDHDLLGKLAAALLAGPGQPGSAAAGAADDAAARQRQQRAETAAREIILGNAVALLSGPQGLAAYLRTGLLTGPAASISLPLDAGAATETIPAGLRRLVIARDRRCRFPGCHRRPAACQPHHIIPRSKGGRTCLTNLLLLCSFHHLIVVHQWGWSIRLHADGTVTTTSPRGRILHSHGPPSAAA